MQTVDFGAFGADYELRRLRVQTCHGFLKERLWDPSVVSEWLLFTVKLGQTGQPCLRQNSSHSPIGGVSKFSGKSKVLADLGPT